MNKLRSAMAAAVLAALPAAGQEAAKPTGNPADHLPAWIKRLTWFGERPSITWSAPSTMTPRKPRWRIVGARPSQ